MFRTYDKIRRYGDDDVQGIEHGEVSVFPKIDGTCSIVYLDQGTVKCASRNCELTAENHNQHFYDFVQKQSTGLVSLINEFGNAGFGDVVLYGEWLVPHTLRTYEVTAWNRWYIFDVYSLTQDRYLTYDEYDAVIDRYNARDQCAFDCIPRLTTIINPTTEQLRIFMESNHYLMDTPQAVGEGIVIKNYAFVNRYGRRCYAKMVRTEFKDQMREKGDVPDDLIQRILLRFTADDAQHILAKIDGHNPGRFISTCWHDFIEEKLWEVIKKEHDPTIDFDALHV